MIDVIKNIPVHQNYLDEVRINLYSMNLIASIETMTGLDPWVEQVYNAMSKERRWLNTVLMDGLHYVIVPVRDHGSFEEYLEDLAATPALELRQRMLDEYELRPIIEENPSGLTLSQAMENEDKYFSYINDRFRNIDPDTFGREQKIERAAYQLIMDPDHMKSTVVEHLNYMWTVYVKKEWERRKGFLIQLTQQQLDVKTESLLPNIITCSIETEQELRNWIAQADEVRFVPSPHVGPYFGKMRRKRLIVILYGEGSIRKNPVSSQSSSELTQQFQALSDEARVQIIDLLLERGDLSSPEIMEACGFSASGASRHLKLLSALGLLTEYRREGTKNMKCYRVNKEAFQGIAKSISNWMCKWRQV